MSAILLLAALGAPEAPAAAAPTHLICTGAASKEEDTETLSSLLSGTSRPERVETQDSVTFRLTDTGGEARLPKRIQSAHKEDREGWFPLVEFKRADDEITGKIRLHSMYKPRFRLDRLTGQVNINGTLGDFTGTCQPYDPATVERKF